MDSKRIFKGNFVYTCLPSTLILEPNYQKKMYVTLFWTQNSFLETSHRINLTEHILENSDLAAQSQYSN